MKKGTIKVSFDSELAPAEDIYAMAGVTAATPLDATQK